MSECNRARLRRLRAVLFAALLGPAIPAHASSWDFEDGNLTGWTVTGAAFQNQPTYGDNIAARLPGATSNQQGLWWVGTFENRHSPTAPAGGTQGDGPQGQLLSPLFSIDNRRIDFLIGGGNDPTNERVSLIVKMLPGEAPPARPEDLVRLPDGDYKIVLSETGANDERMRRVTWDATAVLHRSGRIQIVDASSGPWGHINVDDFRGLGLFPSGPATGLGVAVVVNPGSPMPSGNIPRAGTNAPGAIALPPSPGALPQVVVPVGSETTVHVDVPTPPAPPADAPSGRFRVYLTGFHVLRQTDDDPLESDGVGDEVYFRSDSFAFANGTFPLQNTTVTSGTFGSNFTLNVGGGRGGGIVTGDIYPLPDPFATDPHSRRHGDLAIVLWEGQLIRGYTFVVLVPSIWEWDNEQVSSSQRDWMPQLIHRLGDESAEIQALSSNWPSNRFSPEDDEILNFLDIYDDGNHPFGAKKRETAFPNYYKMMIQPAILLSYDSAIQAINSRYRELHYVDFRLTDGDLLAPGIVPVHYYDSWSHGEYNLFLKIERLPD